MLVVTPSHAAFEGASKLTSFGTLVSCQMQQLFALLMNRTETVTAAN
jgi:hypothetical protein